MRLLLDTHIFIWVCLDPGKLSHAHRNIIASSENDIFVSAVSAWEIAIKRNVGRLDFPVERFVEMSAGLGIDILPIHVPHGIEAGKLPLHHQDPFDRMLIGQARAEGLTVATVDRMFKKYEVPLLE